MEVRGSGPGHCAHVAARPRQRRLHRHHGLLLSALLLLRAPCVTLLAPRVAHGARARDALVVDQDPRAQAGGYGRIERLHRRLVPRTWRHSVRRTQRQLQRRQRKAVGHEYALCLRVLRPLARLFRSHAAPHRRAGKQATHAHHSARCAGPRCPRQQLSAAVEHKLLPHFVRLRLGEDSDLAASVSAQAG